MFKIKDKILGSIYFSWLQIVTNWLAQGIFHADRSERLYKIFFTVLLFVVLIFSFHRRLVDITSVEFCVFFASAHTLNYLVNCNISVLFIHRMRWFKTNKVALIEYLESMQARLIQTDDTSWLSFCVSHGGICNGTLNDHSDIDVSIVRKPGFLNLMKAIIFYVKEKKRADFNKIPLDIFICDSAENTMIRSNFQNNPIILFDENNLIDEFYGVNQKMSLRDARILNNLD